jgi:hypothetical protein
MVVPLGGLEPPPHGLRARHAALTLQRGVERMTGFEPVPQGLEGPWAAVTPHSLWIGLRVSNPSLHAGNVECSVHTQAEHGPVLFTGPSTSIGYQRPRSCEHIRSYRPSGDSARIRTRTRELWRLGCSRYTTLPSHLTARPFRRHNLPTTWPVLLPGVRPKTKKAF